MKTKKVYVIKNSISWAQSKVIKVMELVKVKDAEVLYDANTSEYITTKQTYFITLDEAVKHMISKRK